MVFFKFTILLSKHEIIITLRGITDHFVGLENANAQASCISYIYALKDHYDMEDKTNSSEPENKSF